jgi:hypothetical protein
MLIYTIALCPNYRAIKTRGSAREQLRAVLLIVAKERRDALMAGTGHGTSRKRLDLDVAVVAGEGLQVVWVAGGDDAAAEADRGGDDEGVDGVT